MLLQGTLGFAASRRTQPASFPALGPVKNGSRKRLRGEDRNMKDKAIVTKTADLTAVT